MEFVVDGTAAKRRKVRDWVFSVCVGARSRPLRAVVGALCVGVGLVLGAYWYLLFLFSTGWHGPVDMRMLALAYASFIYGLGMGLVGCVAAVRGWRWWFGWAIGAWLMTTAISHLVDAIF